MKAARDHRSRSCQFSALAGGNHVISHSRFDRSSAARQMPAASGSSGWVGALVVIAREPLSRSTRLLPNSVVAATTVPGGCKASCNARSGS